MISPITHPKKRKILFVTERRADYSRLKPIMSAVVKSPKLDLQLIVTGMHLLKKFGETITFIRQDGFKIDAILPIFTETDPDEGSTMVEAMGKALIGFPSIFLRLKPDLIFSGFDIGANFAAAITGMHINIPVSHIQGGEISGTIDEIIRHAMTKFSHIHFAATEQSANRIIKMGENPEYVFVVGSPSMDTIHTLDYFSRSEICNKYSLNPSKKLVIFLQHPVTTEVKHVVAQISQTINALKLIKKEYDVEIIGIYSNNDAGGKKIIAYLGKSSIKILPHIMFEDFLRLMKVADVLVGNSSAAIHEAPSFGLPAINIGTRQQHRERGQNIIDVPHDTKLIYKAIEKALFDEGFIRKTRQSINPYDHGNTAQKVIHVLETITFPPIQKFITY